MIAYQFEHICSYTAQIQTPPEMIGPVADGFRANFYYLPGGEVTGPHVQGKVLPVGGDWSTIRTDGVGLVDVRSTIETHDGALISLYFTGVYDLGEDGYQKFLAGELPPRIQTRSAARVQTAHPAYAWLNRLQFVIIGEVDAVKFSLCNELYALR